MTQLPNQHLQYVNISALSIRKPHPVWLYVAPTTKDVGQARIKSKLLIGTYMLQSCRSKVNKLDVDPTCMLCNSGPEDAEHFLVHCSALQETRDRFLPTILSHIEPPLQGLLARDLVDHRPGWRWRPTLLELSPLTHRRP